MESFKSDNVGMTQLFNRVESNLTFLRKRNLSYIINVHTEDVCAITIKVNGRRGTGVLSFVLYKDLSDIGNWRLVSNGEIYLIGESISGLRVVINKSIQNLRTRLNTY